ncbi:MAG: single-stranded DNA-binding protein [Vampirovibrionales bacterium]
MMMSLARVQLCGTLASNAEKRFTNTNVGVTVFNMSVYNSRGGRDAQAQPFPVKVTCWRGLADATEGLQQNHVVLVEGRLQINSYTTPDGQAKKYYEVDASSVFVLPGLPQALQPVSATAGAGGTAMPPQATPAPMASVAPASAMTAPAPSGMPAGGEFQLTDLSPNDFLTEDDIPF